MLKWEKKKHEELGAFSILVMVELTNLETVLALDTEITDL